MPDPIPPLDGDTQALLGFIHRHAKGGPPPPPPSSPTFAECYATLASLGFIRRGIRIWTLTRDGDRWLRARYRDR